MTQLEKSKRFVESKNCNKTKKQVQCNKVNEAKEDKTSDAYVPKSYRSQSRLGLLLTSWLDKYLGIRFQQPIKWKNFFLITALHLAGAYFFSIYKLSDVTWKLYPWSN